MISLFGFCEALKSTIQADTVLQSLDVKGAFYQIAPGGVVGEFVVHQMQSGTFDRTLGGVQDMRFTWQICGLAGERDGQSPIKRADLISLRLFEMLDGGIEDGRGETLLSSALAPLGFYCELIRAVGFVPPRYEQVSGVQKWRCGHLYEIMLEPTG